MSEEMKINTPDVREQVKVIQDGNITRSQRVVEDNGAARRGQLAKVTQVIWFIFGALEVLIGLRIILKLVAANPDNAFASMIYNFTAVFLTPFFGLTGAPAANGMVLEIPSIIGMLIYALLAWGLVHLAQLIYDRPSTRTVTTYERDQS